MPANDRQLRKSSEELSKMDDESNSSLSWLDVLRDSRLQAEDKLPKGLFDVRTDRGVSTPADNQPNNKFQEKPAFDSLSLLAENQNRKSDVPRNSEKSLPEVLDTLKLELDRDLNGYISKEEIGNWKKDSEPEKTESAEAAALRYIRYNYEDVANRSNDQWGTETEITKNDLTDLQQHWQSLHTSASASPATHGDSEYPGLMNRLKKRLDQNSDGFLDKAELEEANTLAEFEKQADTNIFTRAERLSIKWLKDHREETESLSNDEWGLESKISFEDMDRVSRLVLDSKRIDDYLSGRTNWMPAVRGEEWAKIRRNFRK
jgi:hypothetical protein